MDIVFNRTLCTKPEERMVGRKGNKPEVVEWDCKVGWV